MIDTLKASEELVAAGVPPEHARAIAHVVRDGLEATAATKADLTGQGKELRAEIAAQGKELRAEIAAQGKELRAEMALLGTGLRAEMAGLRADLGNKFDQLKWVNLTALALFGSAAVKYLFNL